MLPERTPIDRQAQGMSNAVVVSGAHTDHRQSGRGLRPADRLLRAAAADAAGAPGPGHQRPRRRLRRASTSTCCSAAARTTPGARPPPARTSPTPTPSQLCDARRQRADHGVDALPLPRPVPADGGAAQRQRVEARPPPTPPPAGSYTLVMLAHQVRPGHLARHGRRPAGRLHRAALDLPARGRLGDRVPDVQRPGRDGRRRRPSSTRPRNIGYAFNWFYVNSTDAAYFNSGHQPGPRRRAPTRTCRCGPSRPTSGRAGTRRPTPRRTRPPPSHPQAVNQDYFVSWNNKQARDYGAADGNFSFGSVHRGRPAGRPGQGGAGRRRQVRPGRHSSRSWTRPRLTDLRGEKVLARPAPGDQQRRRSPTRPSPTAVAKLQAWRRPARSGWRPRKGSKAYRHADAIRDLRRLVAAAGPRPVQARPGRRPVPVAGQRPADQRVALRAASRRRLQPAQLGERGADAQGLVVPVRLVGLRRQGPADGARRPGRRWRCGRTYCGNGDAGGLPHGAAGHACGGAPPSRRRTATPATTSARRATSGAPTRSCSRRSAASPTR